MFRLVALSAFVLLSACQTPATDPQTIPSDALLALYRNEHLRPLVLEYYSNLTQDRTVAQAILDVCDQLDVEPSLGFALAWNESKFDPLAVGHNPDTLDRGLFQLNSRTFSRLSRQAVFDPRANAFHGLTYYKKALVKLGTTEKALGYYNSGIGMLTDRPLPRSTVAYVRKVLEDKDRMDRDAIAWIYFSHDSRLALR